MIKITINPCSSRITLVCLLLYLMQGNELPIFDLLISFHKKRRNTLKNPGLKKEVDVTRIQIISHVTEIDAALLINLIM
jgi:hypothetical protein